MTSSKPIVDKLTSGEPNFLERPEMPQNNPKFPQNAPQMDVWKNDPGWTHWPEMTQNDPREKI